MNEPTMNALKVLVERVIRPIRTSSARKLKMREELLTHVIAAFEEEAAKLGSDEAALLQTAHRFGDTDELTRQLQESVPKWDWRRWAELLVGFPPNEPIARRVVRHFTVTCLLWLPLIPIFIIQGRTREWPFGLWMPILAAVCTLLMRRLRETLYIPSKRQWLLAILLPISMPAITFCMCLTINHDATASWNMIAPLIPQTALLAPIALAVCSYGTAVELRRIREWESISLSD